MARRFEPVGQPGIGVGDHEADRAVFLVVRQFLVGVDGVVAVVQRFHPVVVHLKVPVFALRRHDLDEQRFALRQRPVAVVVDDVRVAARGEGYLRVEHGQRIGVLAEAAGPVGEQHRGAGHQRAGGLQALVDLFGSERRGALVLIGAIDSLDAQVRGFFGQSVEEGLAHDQGTAPWRHGQPVPVMGPAADSQFEVVVRADLEFFRFHVAGWRHAAALAVVSGLGAEAQVLDGIAPA